MVVAVKNHPRHLQEADLPTPAAIAQLTSEIRNEWDSNEQHRRLKSAYLRQIWLVDGVLDHRLDQRLTNG
ncbi:MAG: hypothetical protein K8U03_14595 [Planctomycetia bacterium]|nr:hypothetical protein [Planctomycetia bacterium]